MVLGPIGRKGGKHSLAINYNNETGRPAQDFGDSTVKIKTEFGSLLGQLDVSIIHLL